MVTTVLQGFEKLRQNLEITDLQSAKVSTRQQGVRDAVANEMNVLNSFLAGSYKRSTMISPLSGSDIDIFVVLHPEYYKPDGQAYLLDKVKTVLKKTYPSTQEISRNGQAVTITFNDFLVDVVPTFKRDGGGYLIPDAIQKRWISTNPDRHTEIWSEANKSHNGGLVPLIKMIKGWNKQNNAVLRSFHLEAGILNVLTNVKISSYSSGVRYFFEKSRASFPYIITDPAGYGDNLATYLNSSDKQNAVVNLLERSYQKATEAEKLESEGKNYDAINKWREIFGSYFPAYG